MKIERWNSFSVANATRIEAKLTYIRLNTETPYPPRGAVPVNQGRCRRLFHSQRPDRFRSWMRLSQLYGSSSSHTPVLCGKAAVAFTPRLRTGRFKCNLLREWREFAPAFRRVIGDVSVRIDGSCWAELRAWPIGMRREFVLLLDLMLGDTLDSWTSPVRQAPSNPAIRVLHSCRLAQKFPSNIPPAHSEIICARRRWLKTDPSPSLRTTRKRSSNIFRS